MRIMFGGTAKADAASDRAQRKGLIHIRELIGVEQDEANIRQGAGAGIDIGGLKVGDELCIGVQLFVE
jgi:hypothetical protein